MTACAISPTQYQNYLLAYLTAADPCAPGDLGAKLGLWWSITKMQSGCDAELQFLMTKREAIKYLMGCAAYQVNQRDSRAETHSKTVGETRQDGWMQAQQTNQNSNFADSVGQQRYNDFSDASADSGSKRDAMAESHDKAAQCMHDIGHGESLTENEALRESASHRHSQNFKEGEGEIRGNGARSGCNYTFSQSKTQSETRHVVIAGAAHTGRGSTWDAFSRNVTESYQQNKSRSYGETLNRAATGSNSTSQRTSSSYFNAHVDDGSSSSTQAHSEEHSTSFRDTRSHAEGLGQGANESKSQGQQSAQATSQAHSDGEAHRQTNKNGFLIMDALSLHQRFEHLKYLYDQATEQIAFRRSILAAGVKVKAGALSQAFLDECCPKNAVRPFCLC